MRAVLTALAVGGLVALLAPVPAHSQSITNGKVTVAATTEGGHVVGFTVQPAGSDVTFHVLFGSAGNIWATKAKKVTVLSTLGGQELVMAPLVSSPTPKLGPKSQVTVQLRPDDPFPVVSFDLRLQSFDQKAWVAKFGTVPFHFLAMPMPGAQMFYQRGWQIPTPITDPYPMQGKQTGYGKQIRSDWSDNWTYAPPIGAYPMPDVGLWWPAKKIFACYDFNYARLTDNSAKDVASAYVWKQNDLSQFITLAWPYAGGYRETVRYPEDLPATVATHFHFLWSLTAGPDHDPNVIVNNFVYGRYAKLLPDVPAVTDLSWLPDSHRPQAFGPMGVGKAYGRVQAGTGNANWWTPGALTFGGVGWDRPDVEYAFAAHDQKSMDMVGSNLSFMAQQVKWMTIDGDRCCAWRQALEGTGSPMFDGCSSVHNAQTWQMGLEYLEAYQADPQQYSKYLDIIDGLVMWTKHFLYTRDDYPDVPAAQFCWTAAPVTAYCLRYYYTFRGSQNPARRAKAELAYRLASNAMYHFLPTWLADNNQMDDLDSFGYCEPNSGISWLGSACSNEVWCVTFAALHTYLATGDPRLGHYVRGACERWPELFRDEWYPTVEQYGDSFSEQYYLFPGRGPVGGHVTWGGLWGEVENVAWPMGDATVRVDCGEKAALAFNRSPGKPPLSVKDGHVVRTGPPEVDRVGSHTNIADYRYYGKGRCSFRLVKYGLGQPEPFTVDVTFPFFDLRGEKVLLLRDGKDVPLVAGRDYEDMPNRWDTLIVHGCRYGDEIGIGTINNSAAVLPCAVDRVRQGKPDTPTPPGFAIADLRAAANRRLSTDWEDPSSWAGVEPGQRWIFGVPFFLMDPNLNDARMGVRNKKVALSLRGNHLFLLVGEDGAKSSLTVTAGGRTQKVDLHRAVPALKGWPPCFSWEIDMAELAVSGEVTAIDPQNCTVFAATTYQGGDKKLAAILGALRDKEEAVAAQWRAIESLAKLKPLFEKMSGHIAFLPAPKQNPRSNPMVGLLQKAGLISYVTFISPEQLVDPGYFNASNFWVAVYAGGENYYQTVTSPEDGDKAMERYLARGGTLVVLPGQPFPFYYNQDGKPVVSAPKFGLPICGSGALDRLDTLKAANVRGWEKAPRDRKLTFYVDPGQKVLTSLPKSFPFPLSTPGHTVDERWRPIVNVIAKGNKYVPLITLKDEKGTSYGDGAALIQYAKGPLAPGRVLYVWSTLVSDPAYTNKILGDVFGWVLSNTVPPPSTGMAYYTNQPIVIDGKLNDAAWQHVPAFKLQKVINLKGGPNQPTTVKCCWDKKYLYVGFQCTDTDVWATMKKRDQHLWEQEVCEVFIDANGDGRRYKELEVNPLGTVVDLDIFRPGYPDMAPEIAWNAKGLKTAVTVQGTVNNRSDVDKGWTVEMAIPLADIVPGYDMPWPGTTWRVNFYRIDRPDRQNPDKNIQFSAWSAVKAGYHEPPHFGFLTFAADPYRDDFSLYKPGVAPGPPWTVVGGNWSVGRDALVGRDCVTDGWAPTGVRGGMPQWTDYRVDLGFQVDSIGGDWRDGPWFGVRCTPGNGYYVEFTDREVQVHKSYQGLQTGQNVMVARWPYVLPPGHHKLSITVSGTKTATLAVTVDGKLIGTAKDSDVLGVGPVPAGGVVLCARSWSGDKGHTQVRFDHLRVTPLSP